MICPNCGFNSKEGVKFCGKCGKKLPDISDLFNLPDDSSKVSRQLPHNNNSEIINNIPSIKKNSDVNVNVNEQITCICLKSNCNNNYCSCHKNKKH